MQTIPIEEAVARKFRLEQAPTLLSRQAGAAPIAFTRLRSQSVRPELTIAAPPEEAFAFEVALAPMAAGEIWIDGKHAKLPAALPGDTFAFNLSANPIARLSPPYDFLRFYLPISTLDLMVHDQGLRRVGGLRPTSRGIHDPAMQGLAQAMLAVIQEPGAASTLFVDAVALAFVAHVARAYAGFFESKGSSGAGLAPWQLRRACAFIDAHLQGDLSLSDLARECRVSAGHFGRAFRQAVGVPPHQWLTMRRIERAKRLLMEGDLHLAQIALHCGFVDQSHLTRAFKRCEGCSPGKWRRLRGG